MIIDVHSHFWRFPENFSADFIRQAQRARSGPTVDLPVKFEDCAASAPADTPTIVFGGKTRLSGMWPKLLVGTDPPFTTVNASIAGPRALNDMLERTELPRLDRNQIEPMIQRDSLRLLSLEK